MNPDFTVANFISYPEKPRVIRQSLRCFIYGLIGALPVVGVRVAAQALRLHRQVTRLSGETWQPGALHTFWAIGFVALPLAENLFGEIGVAAAFTFFCAVQGWFFWYRFRLDRPVKMNPARHYLHWGAAFAYFGCAATVAAFEVLAFVVARRD